MAIRPPDNYAVGPTVGLVKVNGQIPLLPLCNPISPYFWAGRRLVSDYDSGSSRANSEIVTSIEQLLLPK